MDRKTGAMCYFNMDSVFNKNSVSTTPHMQYVDKFYGNGQSIITKTKVYPITKDMKPLLSVLNQFRKAYYKFELQRVFEKDGLG
jgi:hypothetical protein